VRHPVKIYKKYGGDTQGGGNYSDSQKANSESGFNLQVHEPLFLKPFQTVHATAPLLD
jgi:hypothetical protein